MESLYRITKRLHIWFPVYFNFISFLGLVGLVLLPKLFLLCCCCKLKDSIRLFAQRLSVWLTEWMLFMMWFNRICVDLLVSKENLSMWFQSYECLLDVLFLHLLYNLEFVFKFFYLLQNFKCPAIVLINSYTIYSSTVLELENYGRHHS